MIKATMQHETRIGDLVFVHDYPTSPTVQDIRER